ncbi:MAG: bifunctional phosphopantothenoylcysteine decarboxylase/phosphopantothenate--cysteine ligase CoaBC [Ignavibacteria bacterium]|nr:bifunctional phosphopantothenoylcysteine decarboxylase/phosphopantothenate--cysteine ligase CoaBC [Ignavibacteria bacterium]
MNLILGITGSVSAYKMPWLVRDLRRVGHDVAVIMTPSARAFVAPLALEAVSTRRVIVDPFQPEIQEGGSWHVHLARWADAMLIAPCTATTLSRLAAGMADTALTMVALSLPSETPLIIAPAMDDDMWSHAATQRNLQRVRKDGVIVIPPETGELASGLSGTGRLTDLSNIIDIVNSYEVTQEHVSLPAHVRDGSALAGRSIVITAGPTHEPIDAVRSVVNHSSGTMGFSLAEAARDRGMLVTLITGPVSLQTPHGVERIDVTTAEEMMNAVRQNTHADIAIMAAAVADYTPTTKWDGKIKKKNAGNSISIDFRQTEDILAYLGAHKTRNQIVVGFALEYDNIVEYALEKLHRKNADMIVANQGGLANSGFGNANNTISIFSRSAEDLSTALPPTNYPPMSKRACAEVILDHIAALIRARSERA